MISLNYKKLKIFLLIFFLFFIRNGLSEDKNYLNSVIQRINELENELKSIQNASPNKFKNNGNFSNSLAGHEQRLIVLEEEIRDLNGSLEQIDYKIENIYKLLKSKEIKDSEDDTIFTNPAGTDQYEEQSVETETTIIEDPNIKKNPSMKVLGTVNENLDEENDISESIGGAPQQGEVTNDQITLLLKNPSEIYSYAYDMLVRENFFEAEKSFKAFIGEHPDDPLASNAYYWLGETYYVQKKFQLAAISFARGFQNFPKGNKAIDQLFKLGLTFINLGKNEDACAAFSKLESEFPNAPKRISNRAKEYIKRAKC